MVDGQVWLLDHLSLAVWNYFMTSQYSEYIMFQLQSCVIVDSENHHNFRNEIKIKSTDSLIKMPHSISAYRIPLRSASGRWNYKFLARYYEKKTNYFLEKKNKFI